MISRLKHSSFVFRLVAYFLPLIAFAIAWYLCFHAANTWLKPEIDPNAYFTLLLFTSVLWAVFSDQYKVTSVNELFRERTGVRAAFWSVTTTYLATLAGLFFYRSVSYSRAFLAISFIALLGLTFVIRSAFRIWLRSDLYLSKPVKVLMVGADDFAHRSARRLVRGPFRCHIGAFVRLPDQEVGKNGAPIIEFEDLTHLDSRRFDEVVIAVDPSEFSRIPEINQKLNKLCLPVRAIVDLGEGIVVREKLFQFGRLQMLDLAATPVESLDYLIAKRVFDIAFSLFILVLGAPLFALIAALVKLTSPGPVFFSQERVGLNGKIFKMIKFRTMRVAPAASSDTQWTVKDDPRRTALGTFLRQTSLDELPQFVNVLKGDMSVVGPRPERPHFVQEFLGDMARYNDRHRLKVGITGWAQVNGYRGDTSIQKRLEYDLYYLQNWSFGLDLRICVMTVLAGLVNRNAY